jgi:hypothetical protein
MSSKFEGCGLEGGGLRCRHTIKEYRRPAVRKDFLFEWEKVCKQMAEDPFN